MRYLRPKILSHADRLVSTLGIPVPLEELRARTKNHGEICCSDQVPPEQSPVVDPENFR